MKIDDIRREYLLKELSKEMLELDPRKQFQLWLNQAIEAGIKDPTAMTVATVSDDGMPNQRIVLLKELDERGFVFFTNYESAKARELNANAKVSLHFPWHSLERQVKVQGEARPVSKAESLRYFVSRPRESQLAAWASSQSRRISSRQFLLSQFESMKTKFKDGEIPLPDFWGGYVVEPLRFEFWQGRENRLHDRFQYSIQQDGWAIDRLAP